MGWRGVFGVLGALGEVFGATVTHAPELMRDHVERLAEHAIYVDPAKRHTRRPCERPKLRDDLRDALDTDLRFAERVNHVVDPRTGSSPAVES